MAIIATFVVPHPPLIIPGIGKGEEQHIKKTIAAYKSISKEIALIKPDTIIISSPHAQVYADYFHISPGASAIGNFNQFGASNVEITVKYDESLVNVISKEAKKQNIPAGTQGEINPSLDHGTMVPLYFINQHYTDYKLVRISPSGLPSLSHYKLGKLIQSVIPKEKKVVWISSGDLSHKLKKDGPYGYIKEGLIFDKKITEALAIGDFLKLLTIDSHLVKKAAECGLNSFILMSGFLDGYNVDAELLSYEGPFGVGYAISKYLVLGKDKTRLFLEKYKLQSIANVKLIRQNEDPYILLARESLEYYIENREKMEIPNNVPHEMIDSRAGVFVSIHKDNNLRGCIGTTSPTTHCIAEEIIRNAIKTGTKDPRFTEVKKNELPYLQYKVDILYPSEPISSFNDLDVKKYGVIVSNNYKIGLLLPNLEGIDTVEQQVSIAKKKAGISDDESYKMERFEVIRHI